MCSVGGPVDVDIEDRIKTKNCQCKDCGGSFKGIGKKIRCPTCGSDNICEL
ncbi:MAG: hypothetical protein JXA44_12200 [Methanospirillaceae archaeon]|nr:hypothetical protein [Methanospirillaceae archaeon]